MEKNKYNEMEFAQLRAEMDIASGKPKKSKSHLVRMSEHEKLVIDTWLWYTQQTGKLSEIIRDNIFEMIREQMGSYFLINPAHEFEKKKQEKEERKEKHRIMIEGLDAELEALKESSRELESESVISDKEIKEKVLIYHEKYPKFAKRHIDDQFWKCINCDYESKGKGMHLHKCIKK